MPESRLKVMLAAGLRVRGLAAAVATTAVFLVSACLPDGLQSDGLQLESETVIADEFGQEWPLTVPSAELYCEGLGDRLSIIWVRSGDTYYPLTGFTWTYLAEHRSWMKLRDLEEIWRENPDLPGLRISIGPLRDRAFSLCGNDSPRQATRTRPPPAPPPAHPAPPASPPQTQGPAATRAAPARRAAPPPVVEKPHIVGETATLVGPGGAVFTVTLHKIIDPAEIEHKPGPGNRLVAAKVELGNISSAAYSPGDAAGVVSVIDTNGNEYGPIASGRRPRLWDISVEPGASQAGFVTFEVPEEIQLGALTWSANGPRGDVAEWGIESQSKPTGQPAAMPMPPPAPAPLPPLPAPPPQTQGETDPLLWFAGGTLHQKTAADWVRAPRRDRLATAADYAIAALKNTIVWDAISDVDQVRPYAEDLVECIDTAYGTEPIVPTLVNSDTAAFCWLLMYPNLLK
ncbi:MAG: DUF2511 domain-containing protein [Actinomycetia bacterium]|nr:DUF2511 domain-containing protein [Actinomycetes bacterium]